MKLRPASKESSVVLGSAAFTLLEVMVACFVFFMVAFSVLELTTRSIAAAKAIQKRSLDPGMVAAELSITNRLEEGPVSGEFPENVYPDYSWSYMVEEVESNGLFRVDFEIIPKNSSREESTKLSVLMFKPGSPPGRRSKGGL